MLFRDLLIQEIENPHSILLEYKLKAKKDKPTVHLFVEGEGDKPFYGLFVRAVTQGTFRIEYYPCGDRNKVLEALAIIEEIQNNICLFFVDKDLTDFVQEETPENNRLYITDYYSIESFLVNPQILRTYLQETVSQHNKNINLDVIEEKFEVQLSRFYKIMIPIMAWVIALKRQGKKPNIKNIDLSKIYTFNEEMVIVRTRGYNQSSRLAYLEYECGVSTDNHCKTAIRETVRELCNNNPKMFVRGKWEAWFMLEFVKLLVPTMKTIADREKKPFKQYMPLHKSNFVEVLVSRTVCPPSLENFIRIRTNVA